MAAYTVVYAAHKTLTGTTPDSVQITRWVTALEITNRSGGALYMTWRPGIVDPTTVPDPVAAAVDVDVCPTGFLVSIDVPAGPVTMKILGNANDYSVVGRGN